MSPSGSLSGVLVGGMGNTGDIAAAVEKMLTLLGKQSRTRSGLAAIPECRARGVYDNAVGALRMLGLIEIDKNNIVSLSALGRHFFEQPAGLGAIDIVAEFIATRNEGAKAFHYLPTIESILRQIVSVRDRTTASLQGSRRNALKFRSRSPQPETRFATTMFIAAIDEEFRRRMHEPVPDGWFRWPETEAPGGDGSVGGVQFMDEGMLSRMEYRVGVRQGVSTSARREILRHLFEDTLPPVFPPDYMRKWGDRGSSHRLRTLAYTIAQLTKNLRRRHDDRMSVAVDEYEADLRWLFETYYVGRFQFDWPTTQL